MTLTITSPEYRTDDVYLAHFIRQSRKRRDLKLSGDMYVEPKTIESPWLDGGSRSFSIDGTQLADASITYAGILLAPSKYVMDIVVKTYVAGSLTVQNNDFTSPPITSTGEFTIEFQTIDDVNLNIVADASFNGTILVGEIKRII